MTLESANASISALESKTQRSLSFHPFLGVPLINFSGNIGQFFSGIPTTNNLFMLSPLHFDQQRRIGFTGPVAPFSNKTHNNVSL